MNSKNLVVFNKFGFLPVFCLPSLVPNSELSGSRGVIGLCFHTVCRQAAQPVARKIPIPGPPVRPPCVAACALHRVSGASARKDAAGAQGLGFCFMRMGPRRPADAPACGCGRASPFERPTHSACKKSKTRTTRWIWTVMSLQNPSCARSPPRS